MFSLSNSLPIVHLINCLSRLSAKLKYMYVQEFFLLLFEISHRDKHFQKYLNANANSFQIFKCKCKYKYICLHVTLRYGNLLYTNIRKFGIEITEMKA